MDRYGGPDGVASGCMTSRPETNREAIKGRSAGTGGPNLENASYAIGTPWKMTTQANKMHPLQLYCVNCDE